MSTPMLFVSPMALVMSVAGFSALEHIDEQHLKAIIRKEPYIRNTRLLSDSTVSRAPFLDEELKNQIFGYTRWSGRPSWLHWLGRRTGILSDQPQINPLDKLDVKFKREIAPVDRPGMWEPYYAFAENFMNETWSHLVLPMIRDSDFSHVVEIGCGKCRNTEKLLEYTGNILATDINPEAIQACKERFQGRPQTENMSFVVVDGVHLNLPNASVTLIYQLDSGVHFHRNVIRQYLQEFSRVLVPGGTGFFHHSNLGASKYPVKSDDNPGYNQALRQNMTVALFDQYARDAGLEILCHPVVDWAGQDSLDAFARFRKPSASPVALVNARRYPEVCPTHIYDGENLANYAPEETHAY